MGGFVPMNFEVSVWPLRMLGVMVNQDAPDSRALVPRSDDVVRQRRREQDALAQRNPMIANVILPARAHLCG